MCVYVYVSVYVYVYVCVCVCVCVYAYVHVNVCICIYSESVSNLPLIVLAPAVKVSVSALGSNPLQIANVLRDSVYIQRGVQLTSVIESLLLDIPGVNSAVNASATNLICEA